MVTHTLPSDQLPVKDYHSWIKRTNILSGHSKCKANCNSSSLHGIYKNVSFEKKKVTVMEKSYFSTVLLFSATDEEPYFKKLTKEEKIPKAAHVNIPNIRSSIVALSCIFPYGFLSL